MPEDLIAAFGLVLVLEGVLPMVVPRFWQRGLSHISRLPPGAVRLLGLASLTTGWLIVRAAR
jgi:uncharacterized protein YjeT (DUF2065 family)